jgi:hypothetical protein
LPFTFFARFQLIRFIETSEAQTGVLQQLINLPAPAASESFISRTVLEGVRAIFQ